jgi:hypothetical protein
MRRALVNRMVASAFVVCLAVGTSWVASPVPAEAQAGASVAAMLPDVVGFRPGMTLQEAYAKLKAYMPKAKVEFGNVTIPEISEKPLPYDLTLSEFDVSSSPEVLQVGIVLPPSPQLVWKVTRHLHTVPPKEDMSRTTLVSALLQKYGRPDYQQLSDSGASMIWLFDAQGRRETENKPPASPCVAAPVPVNTGGMGILNEPSPTFPQDSTHGWLRCKNMIYVRADIGRDSSKPQNPDYINSLWVTVGDGGLATRGADATVAAIDAVHGRQQRQNLDKVQQQSAPKL